MLEILTNKKKSASQIDKAKNHKNHIKYIPLDKFSKYINLNPQNGKEDNRQIQNYHSYKGFILPDQYERMASYESHKINSTYQMSRIFSEK